MSKFLLLLCFFLPLLVAQDGTKVGRPWQYGMTALPSSPTQITTNSTSVDYLYLANTSGSSVTVTIVDGSTNCNGAACKVFPSVTIAANTVYAVPCYGVYATNGISWSANTANVIHAWIAGRY